MPGSIRFIPFELENPEEMNLFAENFEGDVEQNIITILYEYGQTMAEYAQELSPVRTGALRDSIVYEVDEAELMLSIFGGVYYFPFVEFGTVNMSGQFMCAMAYDEFESDMLEAIDNANKESASVY